MWLVTIFNFIGCFIQFAADVGDDLGDLKNLHNVCGIVALGLNLVICFTGVWARFAQESTEASGKLVRYSKYIHHYLGIALWGCAQIALLSAWVLDSSIFYGLLGYQIAFALLRTIYRYKPPKI